MRNRYIISGGIQCGCTNLDDYVVIEGETLGHGIVQYEEVLVVM